MGISLFSPLVSEVPGRNQLKFEMPWHIVNQVNSITMLKGFVFGIGFFIAAIVPFILLTIFRSLRGQTASRKIWQRYLDKLIEREKYEEAAFVKELLSAQDKNKKIRLPRNYVLIKEVKLDDKSPLGIKIKQVIKNRKDGRDS